MVLDIDLNEGELKNIKPKDPTSFKVAPGKRKDGKKKPFLKGLLITLLILLLGGLGYSLWRGISITNTIGLKINPVELIKEKDPELKKDSEGKHTNVLIVGVDSRNGSDISNTDTLIVASYNYETKNLSMISIPRDFHVEINPDTKWFARINSVYPSAEGKAKGTGFKALQNTIKDITGLETQYYALVDFKAFVEIIDRVGGVNINVENSFVDYNYPDGRKHKTVKFTAGPQLMDGDTALMYSRSRYSQNLVENGDYARAKRQQKVILALTNKISQDETFKDPQKVMGVISSLVNNIKISEFTITDIRAGINLLQDFTTEERKTYSFVLDPSSGAKELIEVKTMPSGAFAIGPKKGLGEYEDIRKFVKAVDMNPKLYAEKPTIYVHDIGLGYTEVTKKIEELKKEIPYIKISRAPTLFKDKDGNYVYSNVDTFPETINSFAKYLGTENKIKPEFITSVSNGDGVIILLGKPTQLSTSESEI